MDGSKIIRRRNVVVLGKTGAGKSTVGNRIAGQDSFFVADSPDSVTTTTTHQEVAFSEPGNVQYHLKVIDTIGIFDNKKTNKAAIQDVKRYFRSKIPEGISLFLFVFRQGRFTPEEKATFDFLTSNFREHISPISALVVTGCEQKGEAARKRIKEDIRAHAQMRDMAKFTQKGIYCVGFPNIEDADEDMQSLLKKRSEKDEKMLRELVYSCGDMRLNKEIFQESIWERMKLCPIF